MHARFPAGVGLLHSLEWLDNMGAGCRLDAAAPATYTRLSRGLVSICEK